MGRSAERRAIASALEVVRNGQPALIVISGPAGIGKTALAAQVSAAATGFRVLTATAERSEKVLDFGVVDQLLSQLAGAGYEPATKAAMIASRQASFAVGTRLLELIGEVQSEPLLLLLDDAHWADEASLQALSFVFRRLHADRVALIVTVRDDESLPPAFQRFLENRPATQVKLAGLAPGEIEQLTKHFYLHLSRQAVDRLHTWTDGNPLHIGAVLSELDADVIARDVHAPLPAPRPVADLVRSRLAKCAPEARTVMEAASVLGVRSALEKVLRLVDLEQGVDAVDLAIQSGLVASHGSGAAMEIRFAHPLMASAVYHAIPLRRRSDLHRRAADVVDEEALVLHHQVLSRTGPDAELADRLEAFSRGAAANGSWSVAASALEQAAELTADGQLRELRELSALECRLTSGEVQATSIIDRVSRLPFSAAREYILGRAAWSTGNSAEGERRLTDAWKLLDPVPDSPFAPQIAGWLGAMMMNSGRATQAVEWAGRALKLLPPGAAGDFAMFSYLGALAMRGDGRAVLHEVAHLPSDPRMATPQQMEQLMGRGVAYLWSGDPISARPDLECTVRLARERASLALLIVALCLLSDADFRLGEWDAAILNAELATSTADATDLEYISSQPYAMASSVLIARGQWDSAEAHIRGAELIARQVKDAGSVTYSAVARARLELLRDRPAEARVALDQLRESKAESNLNPSISPWRLLYAQAQGRLGDLDGAQMTASQAEQQIREGRHHSELALMGRVKAELLARRGDHKAAVQVGEAAIAEAKPAEGPYEFACLQLEVGAILRRIGRRREAKRLLESSRQTLVQLDAIPVLTRCDAELAGTGLRPVRRTPDSRHLLTPQELAVARLAADGLANKQIAAQLVISPRTVDYHLVHVFAKLGVESRTQLSRRFPRVMSGSAGVETREFS